MARNVDTRKRSPFALSFLSAEVGRATSSVVSLASMKPVKGLFTNRIRKEDLKIGDHIYSWRTAYSYAHHGIYVGEGKVIHFTRGDGEELGTGTVLDGIVRTSLSSPAEDRHGSCTKCGSSKDSKGVLLSCLDCFLWGYPLYRFEYGERVAIFLAQVRGGTCTLALSDPPDMVLHRAYYLLKNGFGCYHIFRNNCEDFAMYCKTGLLVVHGRLIGTSGQAASAVGAPLSALMSSPLVYFVAEPWGFMAITASMYCISRYAADLSNRVDATKITVEDLVNKLGSSLAIQQQ